MNINFPGGHLFIDEKKIAKNVKQVANKTVESVQKLPKKAKLGAVIATFLLPTLGIVNKCSTQSADPDKIVIVDKPVDTDERDNYLSKTPATVHVVQKGENPSSIASKYNVSLRRLQAANSLTSKSVIHPSDTLIIPETFAVKNVKTLDDISKLTGLGNDYLLSLQNFEKVLYEAENDRNGNPTIGVGHWVQPYERDKYIGRTLTDAEVYDLLAKDLLNCDLDLRSGIDSTIYDNLPMHLKESIIDLAFNKGVGAVLNNEKLLNAINNQDYVSVVANLNQDYSVVKNAKGEIVHKPASGLSKRRLYDISNASKIFKNGYPTAVLNSAKDVYSKGLTYMQAERDRGEFSQSVYENVLAEYKQLANEWFDGKLAENSVAKTMEETPVVVESQEVTPNAASNSANNGKYVYVNGQKTAWTVDKLHADWQKTAKRNKRAFARPKPEVDKNGNIVASVNVLDAKGTGPLLGHTIIVNPGHGGAMNKVEKNGKLNVNFDPGTSNAVMSKKNPNIETNVFKGNGGKSLEEWVVNMKIADDLTEKIRKAGGNVIYVQGSVYSAQKAIRDLQNKQKIDMIVSLHSNSDGAKRGIYVIGNNRGGVDSQDYELGKIITENLNKHNWFNGITSHTSQSLGVLSSSPKQSSPIPGILIETGNLKNESDVANLNSRNFKTYMVDAILKGITDYLK